MPSRPVPRPSSTSAKASEWEQGYIPGAITYPRATSSSRSKASRPDRDQPLVLYCAGGVRSLFAAQTLDEMGYTNVASMARGFQAWKSAGLTFDTPVVLSAEQKQRYSRHLLIPEVGTAGQAKLLGSKALLIGAGGLGSGRAVPCRRRRRDDRPRRLRRRRRQQPAAPDHPHDRPGRRAQGRVGSQGDQRPQPRGQGRRPRGDAGRGQRRADDRRLRRHPRRHRHVRDALHPQRRGGRGRHPGRARQRLPVRGPAHDLRPVRRPVLPLPVPDPAAARARARLLRGRRAGRGPRHPRPAAGQRGAQGPARDRQHAGRSAAAVRCPRDRVHRAPAAARSELPGLLRRGRRRSQGRPPAARRRRGRRRAVPADHRPALAGTVSPEARA